MSQGVSKPLDLSDRLRTAAEYTYKNEGSGYVQCWRLMHEAADELTALVEQRKALLSPPSDEEMVKACHGYIEYQAERPRFDDRRVERSCNPSAMRAALTAFLEARKAKVSE